MVEHTVLLLTQTKRGDPDGPVQPGRLLRSLNRGHGRVRQRRERGLQGLEFHQRFLTRAGLQELVREPGPQREPRQRILRVRVHRSEHRDQVWLVGPEHHRARLRDADGIGCVGNGGEALGHDAASRRGVGRGPVTGVPSPPPSPDGGVPPR